MTALDFRSAFLRNYTACAPLALAFERTLECKILSQQLFARPVLDLGCGDGIFAQILFADQIDTGIDPDGSELEKAAGTGGYRELIQCFGSEIPKPDKSYQTVFSNSVLEHIPSLSPVLAEVYRLLAPGGCFYFTVPADNFEIWSVVNQILVRCGFSNLSLKFRKFFNKFWRHHHAYPETGWKALALKAGFEVPKAFRYNAPRIALGNDFLAPFAFPSKLLNKGTGRWVLSKRLRRIIHAPFQPLFRRWLTPLEARDGCLVFVQAVKPLSAEEPRSV
jgi:SAM-dependent methyltransferase